VIDVCEDHVGCMVLGGFEGLGDQLLGEIVVVTADWDSGEELEE
jgi:hypothetical protein